MITYCPFCERIPKKVTIDMGVIIPELESITAVLETDDFITYNFKRIKVPSISQKVKESGFSDDEIHMHYIQMEDNILHSECWECGNGLTAIDSPEELAAYIQFCDQQKLDGDIIGDEDEIEIVKIGPEYQMKSLPPAREDEDKGHYQVGDLALAPKNGSMYCVRVVSTPKGKAPNGETYVRVEFYDGTEESLPVSLLEDIGMEGNNIEIGDQVYTDHQGREVEGVIDSIIGTHGDNTRDSDMLYGVRVDHGSTYFIIYKKESAIFYSKSPGDDDENWLQQEQEEEPIEESATTRQIEETACFPGY